MKKNSLSAIIAIVIAFISMAIIAIGAKIQNLALVVAGFAFAFVGIITASVISSMIKINKRFPSRNDPLEKKARAAQYLKTSSSIVIALGMVMVFVGVVMESRGTQLFLHLAWAMLSLGFVMAIAGFVLSMAVSNKMSAPHTVSNAVPPSISAANIPYSPDPVISRILANPYVLQDERIRQLHEVQNLLQFPEIQQIFFEPTKLYELFTHEKVSELLNIVRDWITQNNAYEIFAAAERK
ncbi:MAG: hypothetical protein HDR72_01800 [Ruminococcaceae bacterium]|nr:hypothetical protein [Oscillospiraceae bacterium]